MKSGINDNEAVPVRAVILAGGSGTRLWPLSRTQLPKQFLSLDGEKTLLQATVDRLYPVIAPKDVLVVTGKEHAKGEAYAALAPYQTLLEPVGRNTAPAIALAAQWLNRGEHDPVMVVLPADHIIEDTQGFQNALKQAIKVAAEGKLVTFGIQPTRPDTGFGYIKTSGHAGATVRDVERFTEKPDLSTAEHFLREGGYYWNSGMFVWRASTILREIEQYLPNVYAILKEMVQAWNNGHAFQAIIDDYFAQMPSISIDYGVLEKSRNVGLIPCEIGWSDVGSWDAVHEIVPKDDGGNAVHGNVLALGCERTLLRSSKRLIAAVGVSDLCVIETPDAVLVTKRGETQRVREVVDALRGRAAKEHLSHLTVQRPWGSYTVLEEQPSFKMKRITVRPGASLSLQRHLHRSEHWIVVSGTATVTRDDEVLTITKNQSTYIPIGAKHRLENRGKIPLELIEVQVGEYLEEDDIQRFDDVYGRHDEIGECH